MIRNQTVISCFSQDTKSIVSNWNLLPRYHQVSLADFKLFLSFYERKLKEDFFFFPAKRTKRLRSSKEDEKRDDSRIIYAHSISPRWCDDKRKSNAKCCTRIKRTSTLALTPLIRLCWLSCAGAKNSQPKQLLFDLVFLCKKLISRGDFFSRFCNRDRLFIYDLQTLSFPFTQG